MVTWRELLSEEMKASCESLADIVSNTMSDAEMDVEFYDGYGSNAGCPFTVWTEKSVYFPVGYDGAEWVGRVSRNPDGKPTDHHGGG